MNYFKTPKGTELPLLTLKGKDYLQVAHRIVWFREEHPDWTIETSIVEISDKHSIFRASIINDLGRLIATGTKSETIDGFQDHLEKSETGSIGRALALCGYGTQFATELDEGNRLADSPLPQNKPVPTKVNIPEILDQQIGELPDFGPPNPNSPIYKALGDYVIPVGMFAKSTLKSVPHGELVKYKNYMKDNAVKTKKPLSGAMAELIEKIELYTK